MWRLSSSGQRSWNSVTNYLSSKRNITEFEQAICGRQRKSCTLAATGYILDQTPQLDDIELRTVRALAAGETPPLGPFRTFQAPIADVGALTGLQVEQLATADRLSVPTTNGARSLTDRSS